MNKIFITIGLIFCFNLSHANSMLFSSGPFYLPDGIIPPKKQSGCKSGETDCDSKMGVFRLRLDMLEFNRAYDLTCDFENPNYNVPYPIVIKSPGGNINGVTSPTGQYLLDHEKSKYQIRVTPTMDNYGKVTTLIFYNYDDTYSVYVKNCKAVYAVQ
ncbi:TPA: hypothetical protein I8Y95_001717 [Legionella pneumophila]|nr:hypothetical protein [Legionella pneumophila]HAT1761280.1 hypothetical protein [Legionella pneumophila]HAT1763296.1 hypothetical protein [Legionella pneumophila]HAT1766365.1 hypothetical protein [Legionella pneumophila]HAT1812206.1 hypothetical protein [Legionella pneumophila]